jgi:hypothetical protein
MPATVYYVRAYATNSAGTSYGNQIQFTTNAGQKPTITTSNITNITTTTATGGGNVTTQGTTPVSVRGVCWSTTPNPTTTNSHTSDGSGAGNFNSNLTSLSPAVTYYVRAYATNSAGTSYGVQVQFTTDAGMLPTVTSSNITNITATAATGGGNVTSQGSTTVTARGVCWSFTINPTISDSHTSNGSGTGSFTSSLTGLTASMNYYVRAYATNMAGTAYGNQVQFTTDVVTLPVVTTNSITNITPTTATGGGYVNSSGGGIVTARGVCWSTSTNPTISDSHTTNGSGTGSFTSSLTGLSTETTYYVRAYATNNAGTAYGNQQSFATNNAIEIGDTYAGGIVFYLNGTGGGLVCAPTNHINFVEWGCYGTIIGGTSTAIGTGASNTVQIVAGCSQASIAAKVCNDLILNGYSDWFLPSKDELNLMYQNLEAAGIGGFEYGWYWSSSEVSNNYAWGQNFGDGWQGGGGKGSADYVRAVRAF